MSETRFVERQESDGLGRILGNTVGALGLPAPTSIKSAIAFGLAGLVVARGDATAVEGLGNLVGPTRVEG